MSLAVVEPLPVQGEELQESLPVLEEAVREGGLVDELGYAPSDRDREIYEAICIRCRGAADVGREFGLAPTTIRNIACETQRKLARRQHELDKRTSCDTLALYFDRFSEQLAAIDRVWQRSLADQESTQRTTTRTGRAEMAGPEGDPRARMERIVERESVLVRAARPDLRCIALANRILRDMQAIEEKFKRERQRERDEQAIAARVDRALLATRSVSEEGSGGGVEERATPVRKAMPALTPGSARQAEPTAQADRAYLERLMSEAERKARGWPSAGR